VLDGRHARSAVGVAQHRGELGRGDVVRMRADFALRPALCIETDEHDSGAGVGRMKRNGDSLARMNADA
jgi:hypothetical protein